MELSHFSELVDIFAFNPRPVRVPVDRPIGQEWLNGPLVWAIDRPHSILYLFPRECPRIVVWPTAQTTSNDRQYWTGSTSARAVAYVEQDWLDRIERATIFRYEMPFETFKAVGEVGMWVSPSVVLPSKCEVISRLPQRLADAGVELRALPTLVELKPIWNSTLHASGIRLRNASGWGAPGWPHSAPI
jgi:hypothetical protein